MDIPSPTLPMDHPDRCRQCAIHMENAIMGLWEFFEDAGWTDEEFDRALLEEAMHGAPLTIGALWAVTSLRSHSSDHAPVVYGRHSHDAAWPAQAGRRHHLRRPARQK